MLLQVGMREVRSVVCMWGASLRHTTQNVTLSAGMGYIQRAPAQLPMCCDTSVTAHSSMHTLAWRALLGTATRTAALHPLHPRNTPTHPPAPCSACNTRTAPGAPSCTGNSAHAPPPCACTGQQSRRTAAGKTCTVGGPGRRTQKQRRGACRRVVSCCRCKATAVRMGGVGGTGCAAMDVVRPPHTWTSAHTHIYTTLMHTHTLPHLEAGLCQRSSVITRFVVLVKLLPRVQQLLTQEHLGAWDTG